MGMTPEQSKAHSKMIKGLAKAIEGTIELLEADPDKILKPTPVQIMGNITLTAATLIGLSQE